MFYDMENNDYEGYAAVYYSGHGIIDSSVFNICQKDIVLYSFRFICLLLYIAWEELNCEAEIYFNNPP